MNITIIGTGNMARAIATRVLAGGHTLTIHARDNIKASALAAELGDAVAAGEIGDSTGDVVIVTLPYTELADIVKQYDGFKGATVVDITNPIDFTTFQLIPAAGTSAAEEFAKLAPEANIVKAFNTTFAGPLTTGKINGKPLDIFIVGDDDTAKANVSQLITDGGLRVIDFGALTGARHLEGFQYLHMAAQDNLGTGWMSGIAIVS